MTRWAMMMMLPLLWADASARDNAPRLFVLDPGVLVENRRRVLAGDPALDPAMQRLIAEAGERLEAGPFSVTNKSAVASADQQACATSQK